MVFEPVLIIGAGLCGLAIAHGLEKNNIPYLIFEAEGPPVDSTNDGTVTVFENAPKISSLFPDSIVDQIRSCSNGKVYRYERRSNGKPSQVLKSGDEQSVGEAALCKETLALSRLQMRRICEESITLHYHHTLERISFLDHGDVIAVFADGKHYLGSMVVGADGSRSTVRKLIFNKDGADPVVHESSYMSFDFCSESLAEARSPESAAMALDGVIDPTYAVRVTTLETEDAAKVESWKFQVVLSWKDTGGRSKSNNEKQQEINKKAGMLIEPIQSSLLRNSKKIDIECRNLESWSPLPWHTRGGRVTLAGDAAHSSTPLTSNGLDDAIWDADRFVAAVKGIVHNGAIKAEVIPAYSREVAVRGALKVQESREKANMMLGIKCNQDSASNKQDGRRRSRQEHLRGAWARTKSWASDKIENLDINGEYGTMQTPWMTLGQRRYASRRFPD